MVAQPTPNTSSPLGQLPWDLSQGVHVQRDTRCDPGIPRAVLQVGWITTQSYQGQAWLLVARDDGTLYSYREQDATVCWGTDCQVAGCPRIIACGDCGKRVAGTYLLNRSNDGTRRCDACYAPFEREALVDRRCPHCGYALIDDLGGERLWCVGCEASLPNPGRQAARDAAAQP